jgi:hypothetical protein
MTRDAQLTASTRTHSGSSHPSCTPCHRSSSGAIALHVAVLHSTSARPRYWPACLPPATALASVPRYAPSGVCAAARREARRQDHPPNLTSSLGLVHAALHAPRAGRRAARARRRRRARARPRAATASAATRGAPAQSVRALHPAQQRWRGRRAGQAVLEGGSGGEGHGDGADLAGASSPRSMREHMLTVHAPRSTSSCSLRRSRVSSRSRRVRKLRQSSSESLAISDTR